MFIGARRTVIETICHMTKNVHDRSHLKKLSNGHYDLTKEIRARMSALKTKKK